jgi:hypothetical protein
MSQTQDVWVRAHGHPPSQTKSIPNGRRNCCNFEPVARPHPAIGRTLHVPKWFTSVLSCPVMDQAGRRGAGFARFPGFLDFELVYPAA